MDQQALERFQPVNKPPYEGHPLFRVKATDLIESIEISTIEARETVRDPLGAAPQQPFGFLNSLWLQFREGLKDDEKLWSFKSTNKTGFFVNEMYRGYARVKGSEIEHHFIANVVKLSREED